MCTKLVQQGYVSNSARIAPSRKLSKAMPMVSYFSMPINRNEKK